MEALTEGMASSTVWDGAVDSDLTDTRTWTVHSDLTDMDTDTYGDRDSDTGGVTGPWTGVTGTKQRGGKE